MATRRFRDEARRRSVTISAQRSTSSPCRTIWAVPMAPSSMQRRGARLAPLPCATARSCLFSLVFGTERPPFGAYPDKAEQIRRTSAVFANDGWEVPRLLNALRRADDLYFDTVSQIRMPCWSRGRISLVGDAAFAPSFRSGQGTSLALVGAYVLAGELAAHDDPANAFAAYERIMRPFVEANQALATKENGS